MDRRTFLTGLGTATAAGLAGCTSAFGGSALSESEYDVGMSASAFEPSLFELTAGDTLTWGNSSQRAHTVTAVADGIPDDAAYFASGGFDSQEAAERGWKRGNGGIPAGETYSHTFEVPGEYTYYCIPHRPQGMVGKIVVTD